MGGLVGIISSQGPEGLMLMLAVVFLVTPLNCFGHLTHSEVHL